MIRPHTVRATVTRRRPKRHGPPPGSEEELHRAVAQYLERSTYPHECLWWHTPNGGGRGPAEGGILKAMGVKAGIPDLFILRNGLLFGIELKSEDGNVSPSQGAMIMALDHHNVPVVVCRSIDEVEAALRQWSIPTHGRIRTGP